jgi:hypothetical protein
MNVYVSVRLDGDLSSQNQWDYLLSTFGVPSENVWLRGAGFEDINYNGPYTQTHVTTADLDPNIPLVVIQPKEGRYIKGIIPLTTFVHPANAIYVFGANNANLNDEDDLGGRVPDYLVYIPTEGRFELYSWSAAAIVLWDRTVKLHA